MNANLIKYAFYALYTYAGAHACHDLYRVGGKVLAKVRESKAQNDARIEATTSGERPVSDVAQTADIVRDQALGAQTS